jgi:precorrin-6Y C5,15-methyltransferase (decarboxylating)
MSTLLDRSRQTLPSDGRIVLNLATFENMAEVLSWAKEAGLEPDIVQIQVGRGKPLIGLHRIEALNPVWIVTIDLAQRVQKREKP